MSLSTSIEVDRPAAEVFTYVTDPSRFVEWQDKIVSGHLLSDGPPSAGDRCLTTRRIGFSERLVTSDVTHVDPPRSRGIRGIDGPIRAVVEVTVKPLDDGLRSVVTIEIDFTGHGIGKLIVPLVVREGGAVM